MEWLYKLKDALLDQAGDQAVTAVETSQPAVLAKKEQTPAYLPPVIDGPDLLAALLGGGALYELGSPYFLLLAIAQYFIRRSPGAALWLAQAIYGDNVQPSLGRYRLLPGLASALPALAEPPKAVEPPAKSQPVVLDARPEVRPSGAVVWTTETAIAALPPVVLMRDLQTPASATAVPLGINHLGEPVWGDLMADLLHVGIYGTSGAGKDTLLRVWFATLTARTTPEAIQFAFIDGKGDWLTPDLADLACMFIKPAGGYGDRGKLAILNAIKLIDAEAQRRQECIFPNGCRSREQYNKLAVQKGWEPLPLLVVVASDVMDSVAGEVEQLLASLVSKARALGIRVIASMQTPTGKGMDWRMNLSSVLAGALVDGTQDGPALGVREVKDLPFRPSKVPPPPDVKGVFVAKVRGTFTVLRTPVFLADGDASEDHFNRLVAGLPKKGTQPVRMPAEPAGDGSDDYLAEMLGKYGSVKPSGGSDGGREAVVTAEVPPVARAVVRPLPPQIVAEETIAADISAAATELREVARKLAEVPPEDRPRLQNVLQLIRAGATPTGAIERVYRLTGGRQWSRVLRWVRLHQEAAELMVEYRRLRAQQAG